MIKRAITITLFILFSSLASCTIQRTPAWYDLTRIDVGLDQAPALSISQPIGIVNICEEHGKVLQFDPIIWTDFLIEQLKRELTKRGVTVDADSGRKVLVRVTHANAVWTFTGGHAKVAVNVSCGTFKKTYQVDHGRGGGADRAMYTSIHKILVEIMTDPLFIKAAGGHAPVVAPVPAQPKGAVCAACQAAVASNVDFCPKCGKKVNQPRAAFCSGCGKAIKESEAFCPGCGKKTGQ